MLSNCLFFRDFEAGLFIKYVLTKKTECNAKNEAVEDTRQAWPNWFRRLFPSPKNERTKLETSNRFVYDI